MSAALGFAAFVSGFPLAFLAVFAADLAVAGLATVASERTFDLTGTESATTMSPEELALYVSLHCGVLAMLLITFPRGLVGAALLLAHQALLALNARRLPAA